MSEYDEHEEERRHEEHPEAAVHTAKWSAWVWVIPALAVFFVGFLIVRYGFFGGGDITVRFIEARGLDRYSPVKFRGAKVGTVQKISIDRDMKSVVVRISMDAVMNHALRKDTKFWIVEGGIEGGLGGILSGTYIAISPGGGDDTREFVGQEYAPVLFAPEAGKTVVLEAQGLGSISIGSPVLFQGIRVGRILGAEYDPRRGVTSIHAFIVHRFQDSVRQSTRFWRAGGLQVSLSGGGVSMSGASLSSLLSAPISFYTPEILAGAPVAEGTRFELYESESAAIAAADGPHLTYVTYFPGPVRGLQAGTAVSMKGVKVGRVRDVRLRYVPQNASLETPVTIEIDPRLLEMPVSAGMTRADVRAMMNDALAKLVNKGMRATLNTSLVLPGASGVSLETVGRPGTGRLVVEAEPPIIPAASAGSGLEGALGAVNDIAARIRALPLEEIAGNLRTTSQRINALVQDPALDQSLQRLNRSLANVERVASTAAAASENLEPIAASLRSAASSADAAAKRAEQLMGTSARQNYDLGELIKELTRAAEAVRALADYIAENPDALLKGRAK